MVLLNYIAYHIRHNKFQKVFIHFDFVHPQVDHIQTPSLKILLFDGSFVSLSFSVSSLSSTSTLDNYGNKVEYPTRLQL